MVECVYVTLKHRYTKKEFRQICNRAHP